MLDECRGDERRSVVATGKLRVQTKRQRAGAGVGVGRALALALASGARWRAPALRAT
jgi:hypothetical protein